jgi:hypothetical protein
MMLTLLLWLLPGRAQGQTRTLIGTVRDSVTEHSLAGASMTVWGTGDTASIREGGQFTLPDAPGG